MLVKKEQVIYKIDPNIKPCIDIIPGEIITLELVNAFGKSFDNVLDFENFMSERNSIQKKALNHPCTGPIRILTDKKDIGLEIEIIDIQATRGYQCISKSTGFLKEKFDKRFCEIFEVIDNKIYLGNNDIVLGGKAKLGFISTVDNEIRSVGRCSENGGNIDLNYLDKGSRIYLPVNYYEPRLLVGDLHICEGNGESAGMGIEADGIISIRVNIVDKINFPVFDDNFRIFVVGWGENSEQSQKKAVENTMIYLSRMFPFCNWPQEQIYKFISAEGNIEIGNATGTIKTCALRFHKNRIHNKYGFLVFK